MRTFRGDTSFSGMPARLIYEFKDNRTDVSRKYLQILHALGASCTEVAREQEVRGIGVESLAVRAYHRYICPPQADVFLYDDGNGYYSLRPGIVRETKTAHSFERHQVLGAFGLELDLGRSPHYGQPEMRVYDLLGGGSVVPEALVSLLTPTPEV